MFKTLDTFDSDFSADSVEWCPIEGFKDILVCGTYQLFPEERQSNIVGIQTQKRQGKIHLLRIVSPGVLKLLHEVNVAAILDMKWAHVMYNSHILLGLVNATGYLQIWKLSDEKIILYVETKVRNVNDDYLALSLDWNSRNISSNQSADAKITISDSKGYVTVYSLSHQQLNIAATYPAHQFEAWITSFNYWNTNIIYSGGDDCKFRSFDLRAGLQPVSTNNGSHMAGVTSLHSNAGKEYVLASGSYDEILRIWDTRNMRSPISEINLAGGIWRLKWDPHYYKYLLAACMYNHFKIIDCNNSENPIVTGDFKEHESIAYGCDWSFHLESDIVTKSLLPYYQSKTVFTATCSFYDHILKLATVRLPE